MAAESGQQPWLLMRLGTSRAELLVFTDADLASCPDCGPDRYRIKKISVSLAVKETISCCKIHARSRVHCHGFGDVRGCDQFADISSEIV